MIGITSLHYNVFQEFDLMKFQIHYATLEEKLEPTQNTQP